MPDRPTLAPPPPALRDSWRRRFSAWLWGYDYFISYHWDSGGVYALALAERLRDRGYSVFLDRAEFAMGEDWKAIGERALRNTQRLVLIASREALTVSKPVELEVKLFQTRNRHVIPVIFSESTTAGKRSTLTDLQRSEHPVVGLLPESQLFIEDELLNLPKGPKVEVVESLVHTYGVMRRRNIRATILGVLALCLFLFAGFTGISWLIARTEREDAQEAAKREKTERGIADVQRNRAVSNLAEANRQTAGVYWQLAVKAQENQRFGLHSAQLLLRGAAARAQIEEGLTTEADRQRLSSELLAAHFATSEIVRTWVLDRPVAGVRVSRNGTRVLAWAGKAARLYDLSATEPVRVFEHLVDVKGAEFSQDESRVLVWGGRSLRLWDTIQSTPIQTYSSDDDVERARMDRSASRVLSWSRSRSGIQLWSEADSQPVRTLGADQFVSEARWSKDEKQVIASVGNGDVMIWEAHNPEPLHVLRHKFKSFGVSTIVEFSSDGRHALTRGFHDRVRLWDLTSDRMPTILPDSDARFNHDGSRILSWSPGHLSARLWDVTKSEPVREFKHAEIEGAQLSTDERFLLTWGGFREQGEARLWDLAKPEPVKIFRQGNSVSGAQFSPDGHHVMTWGGWDDGGEVRLWNSQWGGAETKPVRTFGLRHWLMSAQFTSDGSRILTWSDDRKIARSRGGSDSDESRMEDMRRSCCVHVFDVARPDAIETFNGERPVTFGQDESSAVTYDSNRIRVWTRRQAEPVRVLRKDSKSNDWVRYAQFSRDGCRVLTRSDYSTVQLWDLSKPDPIQVLEHKRWVVGVQFSRDETMILTWGDRGAHLWRPPSQVPVKSFTHEFSYASARVIGARLSDNDTHLLTWSDDKTAILWDVDSQKAIRTFKYTLDSVPQLTSGGRVLVKYDRKAQLWDPGQTTPLQSFDGVSGAQLGRDGARILTWTEEGAVKLWNVGERAPVYTVPCGKRLRRAHFNSDASRINVWLSDGSVRSWPVDQSDLARLQNFRTGYKTTLFTRNGSRAVAWRESAGFDPPWDGPSVRPTIGEAWLWDETGSRPTNILRHRLAINGAQFTRDESRLLTWSNDGAIGLWHVGIPVPIVLFDVGTNVYDAQFSPDEKRLLARTSNKVLIWECSDLLTALTPDERILELEVRTGTYLDAAQNLYDLRFEDWQAKSRSPEYARVVEKLARGPARVVASGK